MPISLKNAANAAVVYNPLRSEGSKTLYIGVSHSDIAKDQLSLSTTAPKRSANSYGNRRATFNVVRTVTVGTPMGATESKDAKLELNSSLPVGMSDAEVDELFARAVSLAKADYKSLAVTGKTQF